MKQIFILALAGLAGGCMDAEPVAPSAADSARLADALEGRVAGTPVDCVSQRDLRGNRSAGEGAIIFDGPGDLIYVNRPPAGCPTLDSGRFLVTNTPSGRLCRGDIVTVADSAGGIQYGSCGLGEFTPYRRAN